MPDVKFGTLSLANCMLGTNQVEKIYFGDTEVWSHTIPIPTNTINYFSISETSGRYSFAVGDTWLWAYATNNIYQYDITNTSSPVLLNTYTHGVINRYNGYQSNSNNIIFEAFNTSNRTTNKLSCNVSTGALSVTQTQTIPVSGTVSNSLGCTNTGIIQQVGSGSISSLSYATYWNGQTVESGLTPGYSGFMQTEDESYLCFRNNDVYKLTSTGSTQLPVPTSTFSIQVYYSQNSCFYKDGYVYYTTAETAANSICKRSVVDLSTLSCSYQAESGYLLRMIGEINGYIYAIYRPSSTSSSSVVKLLMLRSSDLALVSEEVLPNDPFNQYSGNPTFWINPVCVAQSSKNGYLTISSYHTSAKLFFVMRIKQN